MKLLKKIRKKGMKKCLIAIERRIIRYCNHFMFKWYLNIPIENNSIVLESEGDCCDNAFALYDYMKKNDYLKKYKITWLVDHPERFKEKENVVFLQKQIYLIFSPKTIRALRTCKWYIYDHCNIMADYYKREGQQLIYLSHGWGYKVSKGGNIEKSKSRFDFMTATGELSAKGLSEYWHTPIDKTIITGYPRLDYLFNSNSEINRKINSHWPFEQYKKVIFWMPTFRQSINKELSEEYNQTETGLPLFNTINSLLSFDDFLNYKEVLMVFKLHHLQLELPVFSMTFKNIIILRDENLLNSGIQLYQLLQKSEVLISDYSSIAIDYLVTDRPIIYTLDDYEEYNKSRGLFPANAIDYMPGYHVYSIKELKESIDEILSGEDRYREERKQIVNKYHRYTDGNSSERVLKQFGIIK